MALNRQVTFTVGFSDNDQELEIVFIHVVSSGKKVSLLVFVIPIEYYLLMMCRLCMKMVLKLHRAQIVCHQTLDTLGFVQVFSVCFDLT